jgi:hypothetical protein
MVMVQAASGTGRLRAAMACSFKVEFAFHYLLAGRKLGSDNKPWNRGYSSRR